MKVYRVRHYLADDPSDHQGYAYFSSVRDAERWIRASLAQVVEEGVTATYSARDGEMDVRLTKEGVLDVLNKWASHENNG